MEENPNDHISHDANSYRTPLLLIAALGIVILIHRLTDNSYRPHFVKSSIIKVESISQIELVQDSLVKPILYSHVRGLDLLESKKIKNTFISVMLPAVLVARHNMREDSLRIVSLTTKKRWSKKDSTFFNDSKDRYKAKDIDHLLSRMGTLPNSIVLAQAAVETGWGQSRFFLEGNNVFGIWSYNSNEPRLQAGSMRDNTSVYVRAYDDISESIADYFRTLASARAYHNLRKARLETNDPFKLLPHLKYYSERRMHYVNQLKSVIQQNNLTQYDHYSIDPQFLVSN